MRIYSDFDDFYDTCVKYDQHPFPSYRRDRKVVEWDRSAYGGFPGMSWPSTMLPYTVSVVGLGLCGYLYMYYRWNNECYATLGALIKALESPGIYPTEQDRAYALRVMTERKWPEAFEPVKVSDEVFRRMGAPMYYLGVLPGDHHLRPPMPAGARYRPDYITINPSLRDIGLHRCFNPYTLWTKLDEYLNTNMAVQEDPVSNVSDELKRDAHGFDEHSFVGPAPGERKLRRRANKMRKREHRDAS